MEEQFEYDTDAYREQHFLKKIDERQLCTLCMKKIREKRRFTYESYLP